MTMDRMYGLSGLSLRQLTPADLEVLMRLQERVLRELPDPLWYLPSTRQEQEANLARGDVFGCTSRKKLVGFAVLSPGSERGDGAYATKLGEPPEDTFDVHDVMVHPDYRRRGIHSAFLRLFAETARVLGGKAIYATIAPENLPSIRSFEKAGYVHVKTQPAYDGRLRGYYRKALG